VKASVSGLSARSIYFGLSFILVAVMLAVFYAPALFFEREFFVSDHTFYFEPFARVISESYRHGHLPLWNPYSYCGMPQLANPSPGIFYLPNLLFVVLSYSKAMALILIVHQLVIFVGAFLLIESIGWGLPAAVLCGVIMALNGYMMSLSANYTLPGAASWGVLALYAVLNIGRPDFARPSQRLGFVVLASVAVNLTLMAGRPEVFVPMLTMVGAAAVSMFFCLIHPFDYIEPDITTDIHKDWRKRGVILAWQLSAMVIGILLSFPMILPVYEWTKLSPRATGMALEHVFHWSVNWYDLICMLCPQPLGDMQQPDSLYLKVVTTYVRHYPFLPSALIGPVCFSLFWLGLFDKTFRARWIMLAGFVVALCTALGKYGPLSPILLKAVPFLSVLRYPCKLLIIVIFFVAIFAARGLHSVVDGKIGDRQKKFLLALWVILLVVSAVLTFGSQFCADHLKGIPAGLLEKVGQSLAYTAGIGLVVALLVSFKEKMRLADKNLALLLVVLTAVSVWVPGLKNAPRTVAGGFYARHSALNERLQEYKDAGDKTDTARAERLVSVYFDPLKVAEGYAPRFPLQKGEAFMQYTRELLLPNTSGDNGVKVGFGYEAAENKDYRAAFIKTLHKSSADLKNVSDLEVARFCQIAACKYLSSQIINDKGKVNLFNSKRFKLLLEDTPLNVRLYEVLNVLPRAYFAPSYRTISKQDEAIGAIFAPYDASLNPGTGGNGCAFDKYTMVELDQKNDPASDIFDFKDHAERRASAILNDVKIPVPVFSSEPVVSLTDENKAQAKVSILRDDNEHISLSVSTPADGFVVLNDRFYPGWHAVVDTQPAPLYRANAFMRAVYVGKGQHLIECNYEPESLRNGFYVAGFAFLLLLGLTLIWLKQPAWAAITYLSTGRTA